MMQTLREATAALIAPQLASLQSSNLAPYAGSRLK